MTRERLDRKGSRSASQNLRARGGNAVRRNASRFATMRVEPRELYGRSVEVVGADDEAHAASPREDGFERLHFGFGGKNASRCTGLRGPGTYQYP